MSSICVMGNPSKWNGRAACVHFLKAVDSKCKETEGAEFEHYNEFRRETTRPNCLCNFQIFIVYAGHVLPPNTNHSPIKMLAILRIVLLCKYTWCVKRTTSKFQKKRQSISKSRHRVKCECGFIHKHRLGAFHLCEIGWIFYKLIQARGTVCCHCLWVFQWRRSICQGGTMVMYQLFTKQSGYNSTTLLNRLVCLSSKGTSFT